MVTVGEEVFIVESNQYVRKCTVIDADAVFCVVKFSEGGAIRIRHSRLFQNEDTAKQYVEDLRKRRGDKKSLYGEYIW